MKQIDTRGELSLAVGFCFFLFLLCAVWHFGLLGKYFWIHTKYLVDCVFFPLFFIYFLFF